MSTLFPTITTREERAYIAHARARRRELGSLTTRAMLLRLGQMGGTPIPTVGSGAGAGRAAKAAEAGGGDVTSPSVGRSSNQQIKGITESKES